VYESHQHPPIALPRFIRRLAVHSLGSGALVFGSLFIGMAGYMYFEDLAWRDAFLNAAMLLGGMGEVTNPRTDGGKVFAGLYALYAGLVFLIAAGVLFAPVIHRLRHKFHSGRDQ
jgi:hypothetical protein